MPMLVKPLPWQHPNSGAMLLHGPPVVRGYDGRHQGMLMAAQERGEFDGLYNALDILGSTSWCAARIQLLACCWFNQINGFLRVNMLAAGSVN